MAQELETVTINQTVLISASPQAVYQAFVDPQKHALFTKSSATGEAKVGAPFTAWGGYISGKHLKLEPGKRIVQEWQTTEWPKGYGPSRLELTFAPDGEGTRLTMVHSNVPKEQAQDYTDGWRTSYWRPLQEFFGD